MSQATHVPAHTSRERFFIYEVKLIDEFIERFNDDSNSYIREQCRALYGTDSFINRRKLLKSLFDSRRVWSNDTGVFMQQVTGNHAVYLNFTDSQWYAEVKCVFLHRQKKTEVPLLLHIKTENGAAKWMIAGVGNNTLPNVNATAKAEGQGSTGAFIPTSSYGTNFITFNSVFTKDIHGGDYFEPQVLSTPRAQALVSLVKVGQLRFQYVQNVKYYFLQVPGWAFTVEQFKHKDTNNGWLVSSLRRLEPDEKRTFLKLLLYP